MAIIWTVIRNFQNSSRMLQNSSRSPEKFKNLLCKSGYYSMNSTRTSRVANRALFTAQSRTLCRVAIPEKQGDKTLFINSDQLLFTQQCPDRIIGVTVAFG